MNAIVKESGNDNTALRPFKVNIPDADLADLRRRILADTFSRE